MRLARIPGWLLLLPWLWLAAWAQAAEVKQKGGAFYIYLPPSVDFNQVIDRLKTEIEAQNWEVLRVQDVDEGLRAHYKMDIQNKVVYACKSQYLAQGIQDDPNITLLVPCRIAVYRVDYAGRAAGAKADGGKIVVGVADPVHETEEIGIKRREAAVVASRELKAILKAVADFFDKR
ncbi:MAG: DUF302 domain-containing protein [Thiobacillaceae bacterium]|nr:DUF302 domain-containing protein [Thiobacillaceae bacterium]